MSGGTIGNLIRPIQTMSGEPSGVLTTVLIPTKVQRQRQGASRRALITISVFLSLDLGNGLVPVTMA